MKNKILVVDDEQLILKIIKEELTSVGYDVDLASDGEEACQKIIDKEYDLIVLDNKMPKKNGLEVLKKRNNLGSNSIVIMMTAFGTIDNAVEAIKLGAYDYITKPFEIEELINKVEEALKIKKSFLKSKKDLDENIKLIGKSEEMLDLKWRIEKIKDLDTTVLITGESGTGKGVVAHEIHRLSNRKNKPFIHVNCAVLPESLIESELFGHVKGAFTGADKDKKGKFELATEGTIFLDEIGSLDYNLQAKLLTVLQEKKFEKIGSSYPLEMKARVIAATNINLEEAVRENRFREDLYYRLNVIRIECPSLRYRKDDMEDLVSYIIGKLNKRLNSNVNAISDEVMELFKNYNWPGNIRELENTLESTLALLSGNKIELKDLPLRIQNVYKYDSINPGLTVFESEEMKVIKEALERNKGHRENTAKDLGISRRTLQYRLKKYNL
ncbi:sigma-54 dependent transcriptional regulator [Tissierella praeacuta]|uniref:sigma-54-dependent transcriptional regulator n=1 Tax=Tissierella praeacuta TaxID=43131 RepID=UPI0035164725